MACVGKPTGSVLFRKEADRLGSTIEVCPDGFMFQKPMAAHKPNFTQWRKKDEDVVTCK